MKKIIIFALIFVLSITLFSCTEGASVGTDTDARTNGESSVSDTEKITEPPLADSDPSESENEPSESENEPPESENEPPESESETVKEESIDSDNVYEGNYTMEIITINGIDISEFELVNKTLAELTEFRDKINSAVGTAPDICCGEIADNGHYIIVDGSELMADKYSVKVENGNLIIRGSAHSIFAATDAFLAACRKKSDGKSCDFTSSDNFEGSTGKKEIYTKDQLMTLINQVYADPSKIIIGEQVCGRPKGPYNIEESIKRFETATGQAPGIIGIDLACYGIDLMETDDLQWSSFICDLVDFAADGGIITASAHWENPSGNTMGGDRVRGKLGYDNTLTGYQKAFTDLITEGTEYNKNFKAELAANARFFKALEANGVPIIWRPLHEANGNWFWYCITSNGLTLDSSYVVNIWHYVYEYFTEECGLTNLIWCYGPNYSSNVSDDPGGTMSASYLYPGDEYCDMVGVDWYTGGNLELEAEENYLRFVKQTGKPGAITEFGTGGAVHAENAADQPELYSCMTLYDNLYRLTREGCSFVYLLTWYNRWDITNLGKGDEFMATDMTLGLTEVKAMFDALK